MEIFSLDNDDVILGFIFRNPVLMPEFIYFIEEYYEKDGKVDVDKSFKHFWYQKEFLCDFNTYVSLRASRSAGKTVSLRSKIIWALLNEVYGKEAILYTVPNRNHIEPVWDSIVKLLRTNPVAKHFLLGKNRGINASSYTIDLKTKTRFIGRIAGLDAGGRNVIGLHVPMILVDEAGYYPWDTFQELQPVLNRHDPGKQFLVVGTPSGGREKNVLYFVDQVSDIYSKHRINAFMNPLYTQKDHDDDIKKYGGKDTPDYIHFVLGEHGSPEFSLFDRSFMIINNYPVYKLVINFGKDNIDENIAIMKLRSVPSISDDYDDVFISADIGYNDPTAIYIYKTKGTRIFIHSKIKLYRVPYPVQKRFFIEMYKQFNPSFISVDASGVGLNFYQELSSNEDLTNIVIPVNFGGSEIVGQDDSGREIKRNIKELSVSYLQHLVTEGRFVFSSTDPDTIEDLERMTYTKTNSGRIVYRLSSATGKNVKDDHYLSSILCMSYALYKREVNNTFNRKVHKHYRKLVGAFMA